MVACFTSLTFIVVGGGPTGVEMAGAMAEVARETLRADFRRIDPRARTAREMNHLPIRDGSLRVLEKIPARRKIFTHINNTNPILAGDSPERAAVAGAGILVGEDGMEFEL